MSPENDTPQHNADQTRIIADAIAGYMPEGDSGQDGRRNLAIAAEAIEALKEAGFSIVTPDERAWLGGLMAQVANEPTELGVTKGLPGLGDGLTRMTQRMSSFAGQEAGKNIAGALESLAPGATQAAKTGFELARRAAAQAEADLAAKRAELDLAAALDLIGRRTDIVAVQLPKPDEGVWYINDGGCNVHLGPPGGVLVDAGAMLWGINTDEARTLAAALLAAAARADAAEGEAK